jgi:hypothetical protein
VLAAVVAPIYASAMLHFVQIVYWLALSTWFGGVLFVALSAPVIFNTVRDSNPILPTVLSVNLENQHATLLAGSIVGNLMERLTRIEYACAVALLLTIAAQWALIRPMAGANFVSALLRTALYVGAVAMVVYHSRVLWPRMMVKRQQYLDHADEPEIANPAKDDFDRYQRESVTVLTITLALLLGMVLFSAGIPVSGGGVALHFPSAS